MYSTRVSPLPPSPAPLRPPHAPITLPLVAELERTVRFSAGVARSLRFREVNVSEAFTFRDHNGHWFRASLRGMDERGGEAIVYEKLAGSPESPVQLTLACAVLSRQRMLQVVQKATELGAARVVPLFSEHSVGPSGLAHEKSHAWPGQALRAARQCRRSSVPEVREAISLDHFLADPLWRGAHARVSLDDRTDEEGGEKLWSTAEHTRNENESEEPASVVLAVGPEGGWSDAERDALARAGARSLRLGVRVLRAETAVLVGLTVLQHRLGDLRP